MVPILLNGTHQHWLHFLSWLSTRTCHTINDCAGLLSNQQLCAIIVISAVNGVNIFIRKRSCLLFWLCFSRCPFYLLINEYMDCVWTALTLTLAILWSWERGESLLCCAQVSSMLDITMSLEPVFSNNGSVNPPVKTCTQ